MTDQTANESYEEYRVQAEKQLKNIKKLLKSHDIKSGSSKDWGDAGELAQANSLLHDVELWLGGNK